MRSVHTIRTVALALAVFCVTAVSAQARHITIGAPSCGGECTVSNAKVVVTGRIHAPYELKTFAYALSGSTTGEGTPLYTTTKEWEIPWKTAEITLNEGVTTILFKAVYTDNQETTATIKITFRPNATTPGDCTTPEEPCTPEPALSIIFPAEDDVAVVSTGETYVKAKVCGTVAKATYALSGDTEGAGDLRFSCDLVKTPVLNLNLGTTDVAFTVTLTDGTVLTDAIAITVQDGDVTDDLSDAGDDADTTGDTGDSTTDGAFSVDMTVTMNGTDFRSGSLQRIQAELVGSGTANIYLAAILNGQFVLLSGAEDGTPWMSGIELSADGSTENIITFMMPNGLRGLHFDWIVLAVDSSAEINASDTLQFLMSVLTLDRDRYAVGMVTGKVTE